jgi:hypothetical protein
MGADHLAAFTDLDEFSIKYGKVSCPLPIQLCDSVMKRIGVRPPIGELHF